jgi:2-polyprenyl-6-methoxyphenol hydroxylase-like FAD-dependent oxidoreductase
MTCDNVRMIRGRATGLRFAAGRVIGVACEQDGQGRIEDADFVVDATGRSSRLGDWLERGGWQRPPARRMNVDLNYATAVFSRGDELNGVTSAVAFESSTAEQAGGGTALVAIEDQRWMLVVAGYVEDRPSRDPEDFARRARQQPSLFGEVVTKTRMTEPVVTFRQAESIRRDFHRLDRLPGGLVAAGDAVASFNPVYGQGMTSAILHASCLSAYLRSGARPAGPATGYFARVRTVVDAAWQTSTFADLALPHVAGPYPRGYRIASRLSGLIAQASVTDAEINSTFLRVTNMVVHPSVLVRPAILLRAARAVRRQRRADAATPTPVTAPTT